MHAQAHVCTHRDTHKDGEEARSKLCKVHDDCNTKSRRVPLCSGNEILETADTYTKEFVFYSQYFKELTRKSGFFFFDYII